MGLVFNKCFKIVSLTKTLYMARVNKEGFSGLHGNLVFYTMNGKEMGRRMLCFGAVLRWDMVVGRRPTTAIANRIHR
jgi:hypothetical protein